ncbi:MAG: hypothetical protein QF886_26270 [Planctomycetota bacterium]|nr:hypothetical protein [Planctomycetota bacterium]
MARILCEIAAASAIYGFAIGSAHSMGVASRNLIKFPVLIFLTALLCSVAYALFGQFLTRKLTPRASLGIALGIFRDLSILLASLSPVAFFLAWTITQPEGQELNEYPLFLGLNVVFIAVCGVVAVAHQLAALISEYQLELQKAVAMILIWMALSLFVGGQCAWYLRPFFVPSTFRTVPFIEGAKPDYRGARSFYEAVYHLVSPPPLPDDYFEMHNRVND